ncbi:MAG: TfoX/Sxy family protein [Actinomycetes bacterium]|jgi:TfoX/Sxy family transcriptional regulator of competence genes|nr:TfoX/Sxy family protein [Actinomycetes bacterium]
MAYDEELSERIRAHLEGEPGLSEKRMFGGIAFLINGNMACGVNKTDLIVRFDPDTHTETLAEPGAREFDLSRRPMKGWVSVAADGYRAEADFERWVARGVGFARGLPPK